MAPRSVVGVIFYFFLVLNVITIYFDIFCLMIMTFVLCGSYQKVVIIARSARFKAWRGRTPVLGL